MREIEIQIDETPTDHQEFEQWCKKHGFYYLGKASIRKAWCPQHSTYLGDALGVAHTNSGESFLALYRAAEKLSQARVFNAR